MRVLHDVGVRVNVRVQILDAKTGRCVSLLVGHNVVTDAGLEVIAGAIHGQSARPTHFALGTGQTPAAASDVALSAQVVLDEITGTGVTAATGRAQYYLGSTAQNGVSLYEAGLYVGEVLIARFVFDEPELQPKTDAVAAVFTWFFTFARG